MTQIITVNNLDMSKYFNKQGKMTRHIDEYFDEDGASKFEYEIGITYTQYPADSDIVKMYYAEQFANELGQFYTEREAFSKI